MRPRTDTHLDDLARRFSNAAGPRTADATRVHRQRPRPRSARLLAILLVLALVMSLAAAVLVVINHRLG